MNSDKARQRRAEALAREGLDGKACAALRSEPLLPHTAENFRAAQRLHPSAPAPVCPALNDLPLAPRISADQVRKALMNFPRGTSAGPSGFRARHILDVMTPGNKDTILHFLTDVVQVLVEWASTS